MASKQYPIQSGFGAQSTAAEVMAGIDLRPWAADPALADRLWTLSEQQAGIEFRF